MARRNANSIQCRANRRIRQNARFTAASSLKVEQPVNSCKNRCRAIPAVKTPKLSPTNCYESCSTNHSPFFNHCPIQVSNSPSQNSPCREMVNLIGIADTPASSPGNSITSSRSHSSCRIYVNADYNSIEYRRVYSSFRSSEGSSMLVSPEHPWSNCGNYVTAQEIMESRQPRKDLFCGVPIPIKKPN